MLTRPLSGVYLTVSGSIPVLSAVYDQRKS